LLVENEFEPRPYRMLSPLGDAGQSLPPE